MGLRLGRWERELEDGSTWFVRHRPETATMGDHDRAADGESHSHRLRMGIRNVTIRKLAVPDLTTTVLTLTVTGLAGDSSLAGGSNPRWLRRSASVLAVFAGAAAGAVLVRHSAFAALAI
jgi:hypothetical protein